jgi:signal transduction histidine kinase
LAVFRLLTVSYAFVVNLYDLPQVAGPGWLITALLFMAGWSAVSIRLYSRPGGRNLTVLVLDLLAAAAAVGVTVLVETPERIQAGEPTVPMVWAASAVLAWALARGVGGGLFAALLVGAVTVAERGGFSETTFNNVVLLLLAGAVVGYVAALGRRAELALAEGIRLQVASAERERWSRQIHDGVLQVLALVQRRGAELGGPAAELGLLAGEQEEALRALVTSRPSEPRGDGQVDLRELLAKPRNSVKVHLVKPATPVLMTAARATELADAVGAALHNVGVHVGAEADAWVLIEEDGEEVVVTVRDEGPGIAPGRLDEAQSQGRLGMAQSVMGRVRDLGGSVEIVTALGEGTEVELRVPR